MPRGGSKPGERRGGRKKGVPNKFTGDLRQMISNALVNVGGEAYLQKQAKENPGPFLALLGKTLPKDVNLKAEGGLSLSITLSK
jgi:hypothetical protein